MFVSLKKALRYYLSLLTIKLNNIFFVQIVEKKLTKHKKFRAESSKVIMKSESVIYTGQNIKNIATIN